MTGAIVFPAMLAGCLLSSALEAQTRPRSVDGPVTYAGTYDPSTATLSPPGGSAAEAPVVVFDNTDFSGLYVPFGSLGDVDILMDWGVLTAAPNNDVTALQVAYGTTNTGTVDLRIRIHTGATGFGNIGTVVSDLLLTGLPGSISGLAEAFVIDVDLAGVGLGFFLGDGPIGWSYEAFDDDTGPLLIDVFPPSKGVIDFLDYYSSDFDDYLGSFGSFCNCGSMWLQLTADEPPGECFLVVGDEPGANPFVGASHAFTTQVGPSIDDSYAVLLTDIPEFVLPPPQVGVSAGVVNRSASTPSRAPQVLPPEWLLDGQVAVQVLMWNPQVFPGQPEQWSAGLAVQLLPDGQVVTIPYGSSQGGLDVWAEVYVDAQGQQVLRFPFSIDGM